MNHMLKKTILTLAPLLWLAGGAMAQSSYGVSSPDKRIVVKIRTGDRVRYDVLLNGRALVQDSTLSINIDQKTLGLEPKVIDAIGRSHDQMLEPAVRQKAATIRENYNELRLVMEGGYAVVFRAYNEGAAYRLETSLQQNEVKVYGEEAIFNFADNYTVYYPQEESLFSHNERQFLPRPLKDIAPAAIGALPAVVDAGGGVKIAIAESDVEDYPGLWLRGGSDNGLSAFFPPYPLKEKLERDRDFKITQTADYIAVTKGARAYPWRLLGIAEKDGDLITNSLVWLLAKPSQLQDASWIRPGKVAWDWWNANNLHGVDFEAGVNTRTYEYFIDFAARHGIEYVILDEGWYPLGDLLKVVPAMDVPELVRYGKQKNVGVILWVVAKTLEDQWDAAFAQFERWGVKGLKVDFMQRDDQKLMAFYHRVSQEAARRKLLVDFHGAIRPAQLTRTWPNLLTTEGVLGLEQFKWSDKSHPEHNVTLPFTRMFVGPFDYTPGAMRNASRRSFAAIFEQPMSLGTRCQQLAMYVVFESPLQMLADSPSAYLAEPESMEFLGPVPAVWDETRVLDARLGDFVLVARKSGRDWWVGAMTDATARELTLDLGFLGEGGFRMSAYEDGPNAQRWASDYRRSTRDVTRATRLVLRLAEGGGFAAHLTPTP